MRKIVFIILTIVIYFKCYSQSKQKAYKEWAPVNAVWYYSVPSEIGNPLFSYQKFISIKDTLVYGKNCRLVEDNNSKEIFYQEQNKIFYLFNDTFHLLYDFDVRVNDTISFGFKSYSKSSLEIDTVYNVKCKITTIDTIDIENDILLKITSEVIKDKNLTHVVWPRVYEYTEKIGYEYKFMYVLPLPSLGFMRNLRCYNDSGISFITEWWENQNKECNYELPNSNSSSLNINEYHIYPNPAEDVIIVTMDESTINRDYSIKIVDIHGKVLINSTIHNLDKEINISDLPRGTYIICLYNKQKLIRHKKLIKN